MTLILGILIGVGFFWLFTLSRSSKTVAWYSWFLFAASAFSIIMAEDVFSGSMIEHEAQAGWMGLGMFGFFAIVLAVAGWRFGISNKAAAETATEE